MYATSRAGGCGGGGRIGQVVLGKLPAPGRHTIRTLVDQGPTALAVGAGGVVWIFFYSPPSLSPSLWETVR